MVIIFFKCGRFQAAMNSRPYIATERASANIDSPEMLTPKPHNSNDNTAEPRANAGDFDQADKKQHLVLVSEIRPPPVHLSTTTRSACTRATELIWLKGLHGFHLVEVLNNPSGIVRVVAGVSALLLPARFCLTAGACVGREHKQAAGARIRRQQRGSRAAAARSPVLFAIRLCTAGAAGPPRYVGLGRGCDEALDGRDGGKGGVGGRATGGASDKE